MLRTEITYVCGASLCIDISPRTHPWHRRMRSHQRADRAEFDRRAYLRRSCDVLACETDDREECVRDTAAYAVSLREFGDDHRIVGRRMPGVQRQVVCSSRADDGFEFWGWFPIAHHVESIVGSHERLAMIVAIDRR